MSKQQDKKRKRQERDYRNRRRGLETEQTLPSIKIQLINNINTCHDLLHLYQTISDTCMRHINQLVIYVDDFKQTRATSNVEDEEEDDNRTSIVSINIITKLL